MQSGGLVSDLLAPQLESSCQPPASASARVRGWTWKWPKVVWKEGQDWAARLADEGCNIFGILLPALYSYCYLQRHSSEVVATSCYFPTALLHAQAKSVHCSQLIFIVSPLILHTISLQQKYCSNSKLNVNVNLTSYPVYCLLQILKLIYDNEIYVNIR